jgi:hypothetical protein
VYVDYGVSISKGSQILDMRQDPNAQGLLRHDKETAVSSDWSEPPSRSSGLSALRGLSGKTSIEC